MIAIDPTSIESLKRYLKGIAGDEFRVGELDDDSQSRLPLFLKSTYRLMNAQLLGKSFVLAVQSGEIESTTPQQYARQIDQIRAALGKPVALVVPQLASFERNRLLRQGVPFIVPGRQMFLPFVALDLRERFPMRRRTGNVLTPPSQVVLFFHILKTRVENFTLHDLAVRLKYSAMTLTKVADELESLHLCEVMTKGRTRHLRFSESRFEVWNRALPHVRTPFRTKHWIRWDSKPQFVKAAGMTALAQYTLISDDALPTFAIRDQEYRQRKVAGEITVCNGPDDANAAIECWAYDPSILSDDDNVDRLSLYASLRGAEDPRVQTALKELLAAVPW